MKNIAYMGKKDTCTRVWLQLMWKDLKYILRKMSFYDIKYTRKVPNKRR